jgi:hypothetical protein
VDIARLETPAGALRSQMLGLSCASVRVTPAFDEEVERTCAAWGAYKKTQQCQIGR